jgi:TonB family protein
LTLPPLVLFIPTVMIPMHARRWLPILLALPLAAPAAAQTNAWRASEQCSQEPHRAPRRSRAEVRRDSLSDHVRDAIREDLLGAAARSGGPAVGVAIVQYDVRARTGRMWMATGTLPDEELQAVFARAEPSLLTHPEQRRGKVLFHVRLDRVHMDSLRVGEMVTECRPQVRNTAEIQQMFNEFGSRNLTLFSSRPTHVRALISRDGEVLYSELARSSGTRRVDEFALQMFGRMRFSPPRVNGVAMDVWVEQPFMMQGPPRESR